MATKPQLPEPRPGRWEYLIIPLQSNATLNLDALNRAGAVGWELVQVERLEYLMKRRVG
jgi:hypothetical protein